jgi:ubiquinone/menaquinone biosynthesis C-methylase UbiE
MLPFDWHYRYQQQARWTSQLRHYLYSKTQVFPNNHLLEVGCGTGAILSDPDLAVYEKRIGLDINEQSLRKAATVTNSCQYCVGDGLRLPFCDAWFDLTICHFYLLWVKDPAEALGEMKRVTRKHGYVLAMAEPDYAGRIDYPPTFQWIGQMQRIALRSQGADPEIGRRLSELFAKCGFRHIEAGVMGGQWLDPSSAGEVQNEWDVLREDLSGLLSEATFTQFETLDILSWQKRERVLFVPTFYAIGQV